MWSISPASLVKWKLHLLNSDSWTFPAITRTPSIKILELSVWPTSLMPAVTLDSIYTYVWIWALGVCGVGVQRRKKLASSLH